MACQIGRILLKPTENLQARKNCGQQRSEWAGRWNLIHAAPLVWTTLRPLATSRLFPTSVNGAMSKMLGGLMALAQYTPARCDAPDAEPLDWKLTASDVRGVATTYFATFAAVLAFII